MLMKLLQGYFKNLYHSLNLASKKFSFKIYMEFLASLHNLGCKSLQVLPLLL